MPSLSLLSVVCFLSPGVLPEPEIPVILMSRREAAQVSEIEKLERAKVEGDANRFQLRRVELPSGVLWIHRSADRLSQLEATNLLLSLFAEALVKGDRTVDLATVPGSQLEWLFSRTSLRAAIQSGPSSQRVLSRITAVPMANMILERGDKSIRVLSVDMSIRGRNKPENTGTTLPEIKRESLADPSSPDGAAFWTIVIPGTKVREPEFEAKVGRLLMEYGQLVHAARERWRNQNEVVLGKLLVNNPALAELAKVKPGTAFETLSPETQKELLKWGASGFMLDGFASREDAAEFVRTATIARLKVGLSVYVPMSSAPNGISGNEISLLIDPW